MSGHVHFLIEHQQGCAKRTCIKITFSAAGEFMQLGSKEKEDERFAHYINKSFKKTASLLANGCKAVCIHP